MNPTGSFKMGAEAPQQAAPSGKVKPLPTLLNAADAMLWAADQLERSATDLQLAAMLADLLQRNPPKGVPADAEIAERMAGLRVLTSGIVDSDLQLAAMRGAAKIIREQAHETKLAEARAAAKGLRP